MRMYCATTFLIKAQKTSKNPDKNVQIFTDFCEKVPVWTGNARFVEQKPLLQVADLQYLLVLM